MGFSTPPLSRNDVGIDPDDFDSVPFVQEGGLGRAAQVFGGDLKGIMQELNEVLAA